MNVTTKDLATLFERLWLADELSDNGYKVFHAWLAERAAECGCSVCRP